MDGFLVSSWADIANPDSDLDTFLRAVVEYFGEYKLSTLEAKGIDLSSNLEKVVDSYHEMKENLFTRCLAMVDALLPKLPEEYNIESYQNVIANDDGDDPELMNAFIDKIINPTFRLFKKHLQRDKIHCPFVFSFFLKVLNFASPETLRQELEKNDFMVWLRTCFQTECPTHIKIFFDSIIIITDRLSSFSLKNVLLPDTILRIKGLDQTFSDRASSFVEKYSLNERLKSNEGVCNQVIEVCRNFQQGNVREGTTKLIYILLSETNFETEMWTESDLMQNLLECVFRVKDTKTDDYKQDKIFYDALKEASSSKAEIFSRLVKVTTEIMNHLHKRQVLLQNLACQEDYNSGPFVKRLEEGAELMQYLYFLNSRFIEIEQSSNVSRQFVNLIPNESFICQHLSTSLRSILHERINDKNTTLMLYKSLAKKCPALFPLKLRYQLFQATTLDDIRHEYRTLQPIAFEVRRHNIFNDFITWFEDEDTDFKRLLLFSFEGEKGFGIGPTREFYSLVSRDFQRHELGLWVGEPVKEEENSTFSYTYSPFGLFTRFIHNHMFIEGFLCYLKLFRNFGKLMAKVLLDGFEMDVPLNIAFFDKLIPRPRLHFKDYQVEIQQVLPQTFDLLRQLDVVMKNKNQILSNPLLTSRQKEEDIARLAYQDGVSFEDLCINFTIPGTTNQFEAGSSKIMLTATNIEKYIKDLHYTLVNNGSRLAMGAIREGFEKVLEFDNLAMFLPEELKAILCGQECEEWTVDYLKLCCSFENGYDQNSKQVDYLFNVMSTFDATEQRKFLEFVFAIPRLPIGGLKSLSPRLTISRYVLEDEDPDDTLPSSATCVNMLKLPEYSNIEVTRRKLLYAITDGRFSFEFV